MRHEHDAFWFYEYILGLDCDSKCKTPKFGSNLNEKGVKADIYATLQCKLNRRALRILPKREKRRQQRGRNDREITATVCVLSMDAKWQKQMKKYKKKTRFEIVVFGPIAILLSQDKGELCM